MNILTDGGREFGRYPYSKYGREILKISDLCYTACPVSVLSPVILLDKSGNMLYIFYPLIAPFFIIPCYIFWRFGLNRYNRPFLVPGS
jgi:ABC-2 type transport system permease protein